MKIGPLPVSASILFLFCFAQLVWSAPEPLAGVVVSIYDGDTIRVDTVGTVRLLGIDCPEREASERDRYYLRQGISAGTLRQVASDSRTFVQRLTSGQVITLRFDRDERDQHGRLLAYVYLPDGRMLNQLLLEQGLATVYRRFDFHDKQAFIKSERRARSRSLGIWADLKKDRK